MANIRPNERAREREFVRWNWNIIGIDFFHARWR